MNSNYSEEYANYVKKRILEHLNKEMFESIGQFETETDHFEVLNVCSEYFIKTILLHKAILDSPKIGNQESAYINTQLSFVYNEDYYH